MLSSKVLQGLPWTAEVVLKCSLPVTARILDKYIVDKAFNVNSQTRSFSSSKHKNINIKQEKTSMISIFNQSTCNYSTKSIDNVPYKKILVSKPPEVFQSRSVWDIFRRTNFGNYEVIANVSQVSEPQFVPSQISCPSYALTGEPKEAPKMPELKVDWQIKSMRESCRLARAVMNFVAENIKSGMTTEDIDILVHNKTIESGAYPSPLNYHGFPKSVCTSVNNIACHGIPDNRELIDGDIISVDITVFYNGYHGDCCETFIIGNVDDEGLQLVEAARKCRDEAIAICGPGVPFSTIGAKVEEVAKREKVTVVPCFIGHGIGTYFHGPPDIYHCYNHYPGNMEAGMTFTIEPIVAQGKEEVLILEDGWTAVMVDNGRAAQFEHTILITDNGHEILTVCN